MSIYKKLFEAKKEIGKISKDSKNPFFKSRYFDINQLLEHVEPILEKHNLLLLQPISNGAVSSIIYDINSDSGKNYMSSSIPLTNINDPQKLGSAITYYRRYTLVSLLGLQAEDDDANLTNPKTQKQVLTSEQKLNNCKTLKELQTAYLSLPKSEQSRLVNLKDQLKTKLK